jgi:putative transposase
MMAGIDFTRSWAGVANELQLLRLLKRITGPMMGFKAFHSATATIAGIEAAHMIRKRQIPANGETAFQIFAGLAA